MAAWRMAAWRMAARLLAALLLPAWAPPAGADGAQGWIAAGAAGARELALLSCRDGRALATTRLDAPLAAPPALAPDASALYVATRTGRLQRHALPGLELQASVALEFAPLALAAAGGPDAIVLAGGRGATPLSAHAPESLALLQRYAQRDGLPATVSVLLDNPGRRGLVVGFSDLPEIWEIVYDRQAPPVLLGFVHDYRNNEAVPLPGRLTARPFKVASPTGALVAGPVPWELARIDAAGRMGVLSLELRRELEHPALPAPVDAHRLAAWRAPAAPPPGEPDLPRERIVRGWVAAAQAGAGIVPMRAVGWRPLPPWTAAGEVLAMAPAPGGAGVLVAHRGDTGVAVSLLDPASGGLSPLTSLQSGNAAHAAAQAHGERPAAGSTPADPGLRFVSASGGRCTALLDGEGRWLAAFEAPAEPGAPPLGVRR